MLNCIYSQYHLNIRIKYYLAAEMAPAEMDRIILEIKETV